MSERPPTSISIGYEVRINKIDAVISEARWKYEEILKLLDVIKKLQERAQSENGDQVDYAELSRFESQVRDLEDALRTLDGILFSGPSLKAALLHKKEELEVAIERAKREGERGGQV